ncbi:hypothetical protein CBF34_06265 [Vagococcus penaei]|uniref:Uncharacterized protein n=1 Tax=Vagococcus penaei TaxID=633807 RepID=A0A1Q2D6U2_9ENTE|nr:XRE family transcriptional regulator [Vagococcus penaei]AQP54138.1 hypothetical protein BW732_07845 [Vagococcus penaei]RSU02137.1 hypothetical protein CBF34_06265 [Vagococcus penaei]
MIKGDDDLISELAQTLRRLRKERQLTIEQLAKLADVSGITISNIENNRSNPTINVLWKLSVALQVNLSQLLNYANHQVTVSKLDEHYFLSDLVQGWLVQPVYQESDFDVFRVCLKANSSYEMPKQFEQSIEIITVMQGQLKLTVGKTSYDLQTFDSINFDASVAHKYQNITQQDVWLTIIVKYRNT